MVISRTVSENEDKIASTKFGKMARKHSSFSFKEGVQVLPDALAKHLSSSLNTTESGALSAVDMRLETSAEWIHIGPDHVTVGLKDSKGIVSKQTFDHV